MSDQRRLLGGRYRVEGSIGRGGMAQVYRGTDTVLNRTVAIKVLGPQYASDQAFVERFRREAQAAARLNHPNVVSVYDTGSDGPVHYIVMEYVPGRTLAEVLGAEGHLQPERAAEIAAQVAGALSFAHAAGIVHRDVKPGNIMLTASGEVKVMDFGIARAASTEPLTQTATVLGTASYLSPEQAQGEPVDARSDIYSLGVVLYEMLAGRPPFQADSVVAVAFKHVREAPQAPSRIVPGIPDDLEAIVLKAIAKNPANRYADAQEMREDLERFTGGRPVLATPVLEESPVLEELPVLEESPVETTAMAAATVVDAGPSADPGPADPVAGPGRWRWAAGVGIGVLAGLLILALTAGRSVLTGETGPPTRPHPTVHPHHRTPDPALSVVAGSGPATGSPARPSHSPGRSPSPSPAASPTPDPTPTTAPSTQATSPSPSSASPTTSAPPPTTPAGSPVPVPSDTTAGGPGATSGPAPATSGTTSGA